MAEIRLSGINKIYPDGTHAVHDVDLQIDDGEFMIMVGPSGCAKSTILRMIAGLETPTSGAIEIGGRLVNDVAPKDRDIAMVFQSYALYPHMTVAENMAFGLRLRKMPPSEIEARVNEAARILGLEDLLHRKPKAMSGGQRQRVAMGRAIVREPQAFLMDEPLSNLDAKLRVQMRTEIAKLHKRLQTTTVYVTHDQIEALTLGQRICILRKGLVQQVDTPYMVYTNPANVFVGGFIGSPGMNFVNGTLRVVDGRLVLQLGTQLLELPDTLTDRLLSNQVDGRQVIVGLRPEHLHEAPAGPDALPISVELTETMGSEAYAYFTMDIGQPNLAELSDTQSVSSSFVAKLHARTSARTGVEMFLRPDLEHVQLFDPQTQLTLLAPLPEQAPSFEPVYDAQPEHGFEPIYAAPAQGPQPAYGATPTRLPQPVPVALPAHALEPAPPTPATPATPFPGVAASTLTQVPSVAASASTQLPRVAAGVSTQVPASTLVAPPLAAVSMRVPKLNAAVRSERGLFQDAPLFPRPQTAQPTPSGADSAQ